MQMSAFSKPKTHTHTMDIEMNSVEFEIRLCLLTVQLNKAFAEPAELEENSL